MYPIIQNRKIFLTASSLLVIASIAAILIFGLRQGIDFKGGALWQIKLDLQVTAEQVREFVAGGPPAGGLMLSDFNVTPEPSTGSLLLRLPETSEEDHNGYLNKLKEKFGAVEELRFESIGPVVGQEVRRSAVWAFLLVLLMISLYVAFVFRQVSYPVSSWKYGVITLVTLFHDAIIPIGLTAYLGVEISVNLMVAILVVIGFSVHDTIVVLDRTRENLKHQKSGASFADLVNQSVNQTLARSINTSLTLVLMLAALYFFGPASLSYFMLIILVGTVVGTYSSIYVASSLLVVWKK